MWSYVLAAIGVTGIYFVGRKSIWAWFLLLFNECIWVAYALATDQYGFIIMATAYSAVYIKSYLSWKKEAEDGHTLTPPQRRAVRESIIKGIEALPIESGLTNAKGMKIMAIKVAKGE